MEDLSLHVLDVAENSVRAHATEIEISVCEQTAQNRLTIRIRDNGDGMTEEGARQACDPFFTTKGGKRVGLGLPLLRQSAEETDGRMDMTSTPGTGTEVTAVFNTRHPDMRPMGDILETVAALVMANPAVRFLVDIRTEECELHFDSLSGTEETV